MSICHTAEMPPKKRRRLVITPTIDRRIEAHHLKFNPPAPIAPVAQRLDALRTRDDAEQRDQLALNAAYAESNRLRQVHRESGIAIKDSLGVEFQAMINRGDARPIDVAHYLAEYMGLPCTIMTPDGPGACTVLQQQYAHKYPGLRRPHVVIARITDAGIQLGDTDPSDVPTKLRINAVHLLYHRMTYTFNHTEWENGRPFGVIDLQVRDTMRIRRDRLLRTRIMSFLERTVILAEILPCHDLPELVASYAEILEY